MLQHLQAGLNIYHQFKTKRPKTASDELAPCTNAPDRCKVWKVIQMDTVVAINMTTQYETCFVRSYYMYHNITLI
jgi:hypothetical protein